jgi:hypothetical protein
VESNDIDYEWQLKLEKYYTKNIAGVGEEK